MRCKHYTIFKWYSSGNRQLFFSYINTLIFIGCVGNPRTSDLENDASIDLADEGNELSEPTRQIGEIHISGERTLFVESIAVDGRVAVALNGFQTLLGTEGSWELDDETQEETIYLGEYGTVDGLTLDSERSILLLDGGVFIFDGQSLTPLRLMVFYHYLPSKYLGTATRCGFGAQGTCFIMHQNNSLK